VEPCSIICGAHTSFDTGRPSCQASNPFSLNAASSSAHAWLRASKTRLPSVVLVSQWCRWSSWRFRPPILPILPQEVAFVSACRKPLCRRCSPVHDALASFEKKPSPRLRIFSQQVGHYRVTRASPSGTRSSSSWVHFQWWSEQRGEYTVERRR